MLNKKVILICGYSRGGTNILWNILQSHPQVCSTRYEIGSIFKKTKYLQFRRYISIAKKLGFLHTSFSRRVIDYQLYKYKMETLERINNKFKSEHELYSSKEVEDAALCLKSVDWYINFTDLLLEIYPDMYIIMLTRNGYAVANGHCRRGSTIQQTADLYNKIGDSMHSIQERHPRTLFVKFEDFIDKPFHVAEKLYRFIETDPFQVEKLRLKSKKIVDNETTQILKFGEVDHKYWFGRDSINEMIDKDINKKQMAQLTPDQIREFNNLEAHTLIDFKYDLLDPQKFQKLKTI